MYLIVGHQVFAAAGGLGPVKSFSDFLPGPPLPLCKKQIK